MFALITADGTAMSETALCDRHIFYSDARVIAESSAWESGHSESFRACDGNEALVCIICGADTSSESHALRVLFDRYEKVRDDDCSDRVRIARELFDTLIGLVPVPRPWSVDVAVELVREASGGSEGDEMYALSEGISLAAGELSYLRDALRQTA